MSTEWIYYCNALTTNKPLGDAMGVALDPDPGATEAFTTKLRPIGSDDTEPSAWFAPVPLKQSGHDIVAEFAAGGYPSIFTDAGYSHAQIDALRTPMPEYGGKPAMLLEYGPRATIEGNGLAFIAAQGYEIVPDVE